MPGDDPEIEGQLSVADDDEISDDDTVIRNVSEYHIHNISGTDKNRVSKSAFSASSKDNDPEEGMSVDLQSILLENGIDPNSSSYAPECNVLMTLTVREIRSEFGLTVVKRPKPDNPAHCSVIGVGENTRKKLLSRASWLRRPSNVFRSKAEADQA